jgi:ribosomal protein S27AE
MACCGGGGNRTIRQQQIIRPAKGDKQVAIQRINRQTIPSGSVQVQRQSTKRQTITKDDRCPKCGYTVMLVNIAGRERRQCSNANCRQIIK